MIALFLSLFWIPWSFAVHIGSKNFTESYILAEFAAQEIASEFNYPVQRHFGLGGTGLVFEALLRGEIDIYPEYTGTLKTALFGLTADDSDETVEKKLRSRGLVMSPPLGFNNTYAIAVRSDFASQHELRRISDLAQLEAPYRGAFSYEFMSRNDGLFALKEAYGLNFLTTQSMEHALVFEALRSHHVDVIEVYSTEGKLHIFDITVLEDDLDFFPDYSAIWLAREDFVSRYPKIWQHLVGLGDQLDEDVMITLNAKVDNEGYSFESVVGEFRGNESKGFRVWDFWSPLMQYTLEHAELVFITVILATLIGVPVAILAASLKQIGQGILLFAGLIQTIPSLALLSFLIPFFGIGRLPALIALFLYALLPIVNNTYQGLLGIAPEYRESALSLGLTPLQRLWLVELPLAKPFILAGIKTSVVITIGTATLAALIGAGGYGRPILTGLALHNNSLILLGAIPAALMAIFVHVTFYIFERKSV